jgi:DNA-directed RNA polymerase sigma subunit (sigma70/sigma32)
MDVGVGSLIARKVDAKVPGFSFRYRLSGAAPSIRRFRRSDARGIAAGDFLLASGCPGLAGAAGLIGVALEVKVGESYLEVIADEDAVYGVTDPYARIAGDLLDLVGESGAHGVAEGSNADFEVVVDSSAAQETLLRIRPGKHYALSFALSPRMVGPKALAPARERELVLRAGAGDHAAAEELVEAFLPAIAGVARRYRGARDVRRSELLQEGVVGLLRAVRRFDPTVGTPFWAYASWWVRQAMQQLVSEVSRPTVLSDRAQRALARVREARRVHVQAHAAEPSAAELADATGLSREQVESILAAEGAAQGLSGPLEGTAGTLVEQIADPVSEDEYERVIETLATEQVRELTDALGSRERSILFEHYGVGCPPRTLREIGNGLGLSAERVRQIEEQALDKLRAAAAPTSSTTS